MNFVKVPKKAISFEKPLLWNVYERNGLLLAKKGDMLRVQSLPLGLPDELFVEKNALNKYNLDLALLYSMEDAASVVDGKEYAPDSIETVLFYNNTNIFELMDNAVFKVSILLNKYRASSQWAYEVYRFVQQLKLVLDKRAAQFQLVICTRRMYDHQYYAAYQALARTFLAIQTAKQFEIAGQELTCIGCAALTCDLANYQLIQQFSEKDTELSLDEKSLLEDHEKKSYDMLKNAGVQNPSWLFWVANHHKDLIGLTGKDSSLYVLNDIIRVTDSVAARSSARKNRQALPLFNTVANIAFNEKKELTPIGQHMIAALNCPPIGSILRTKDGDGILVNPNMLVLFTNKNQEVRGSFRPVKVTKESVSVIQPIAPSSHHRLRYVIKDLVAEYVTSASLFKESDLVAQIKPENKIYSVTGNGVIELS